MVADSLRSVTTDRTAKESRSYSWQGQNIFAPTMSRLAPEIRPNDTASSFLGSKAAGFEKQTHFHLLPKLRMRGAIPSLPHVPSWRVGVTLMFLLYFTRNQRDYQFCDLGCDVFTAFLMNMMSRCLAICYRGSARPCFLHL